MTEHLELSSGFQTALGKLLINDSIARRALAGDLSFTDLCVSLTHTEQLGLETLFREQGPRVVAVSELMTTRRRLRVLRQLPITARLVGTEFNSFWADYLCGAQSHGKAEAAVEAVALGSWILERANLPNPQREMVRYEIFYNEVAGKIGPLRACPPELTTLPASGSCWLYLSDGARIEKFAFAVDEVAAVFRRSGTLVVDGLEATPVELIFHPAGTCGVSVTRATRAMSLILSKASQGINLQQTLACLPATQQATLRNVSEQLVAARVAVIRRP